MYDKKAEDDIRRLIHELKSPLTLLNIYFNALEEKKNQDEICSYISRYSGSCRNAVKEIERIVKMLSEASEKYI